eukprot:TRINITY_DN2594_c1_g1_i1.p1 TRINITY_DN2594_c1_g1~~TRINITY_DN2594_c1_g1_i1.p1  ORF type:complete len:109 (+),score=9.85 TRINITY_DN2594_c1_g1_i1:44-370(+)
MASSASAAAGVADHPQSCTQNSVCRVQKHPCGFNYTGYDGKAVWGQLHSAVNKIPCGPCRQHGGEIMKFVHDFVNIGLGKSAVHPANFHKIARQVRCAETMCTRQNTC